MLRKYEVSKELLRSKIQYMKGDNKTNLETHFQMLCEMSENDQVGVLSLFGALQKINGMSEISAFETTIALARKVAQIS